MKLASRNGIKVVERRIGSCVRLGEVRKGEVVWVIAMV